MTRLRRPQPGGALAPLGTMVDIVSVTTPYSPRAKDNHAVTHQVLKSDHQFMAGNLRFFFPLLVL